MTLTTAVTAPDMTTGTNETSGDSFCKWLCCVSQEAAFALSGYGLLSGRSDTSIVIGTGSKILVLKEDSAFDKGMYVKFVSPTNPNYFMSGFVTDYVSGTKTLTLTVDQCQPIGTTQALWIVHPTAIPSLGQLTQNEILMTGGSGSGSSNTAIRVFTTTVTNTGSSMTLTNSATDGFSILINEQGWYSFEFGDKHATGNYYYGITVDSLQLSTAFPSITDKSTVLAFGSMEASGQHVATGFALLSAGCVVRPHGNTNTSTGAADVFFRARRIA
jgi:hypothetical protein